MSKYQSDITMDVTVTGDMIIPEEIMNICDDKSRSNAIEDYVESHLGECHSYTLLEDNLPQQTLAATASINVHFITDKPVNKQGNELIEHLMDDESLNNVVSEAIDAQFGELRNITPSETTILDVTAFKNISKSAMLSER